MNYYKSQHVSANWYISFHDYRLRNHIQLLERFAKAFPEYMVHYPCFVLQILTFSVGFKIELRQLIEYILKSIILCSNYVIMLVRA